MLLKFNFIGKYFGNFVLYNLSGLSLVGVMMNSIKYAQESHLCGCLDKFFILKADYFCLERRPYNKARCQSLNSFFIHVKNYVVGMTVMLVVFVLL